MHVPLIELDGDGWVTKRDVSVNGGRFGNVVCIKGPFRPSSETTTLSLEELQRKAVDRLVIFDWGGWQEPPVPAAAADQCEVFVSRASDCPEKMRAWPPEAGSAQVNPTIGLVRPQVVRGSIDLRIEWTELDRFLPTEFTFTGQGITVECPAGQQVFVQLSLAKTRMTLEDYALEFKVLPAEIGREAIAQRAGNQLTPDRNHFVAAKSTPARPVLVMAMAVLSGCASDPRDTSPYCVSPYQYRDLDCEALARDCVRRCTHQ